VKQTAFVEKCSEKATVLNLEAPHCGKARLWQNVIQPLPLAGTEMTHEAFRKVALMRDSGTHKGEEGKNPCAVFSGPRSENENKSVK